MADESAVAIIRYVRDLQEANGILFRRHPILCAAQMRITPRPLENHPWYLRPFFWNQRRKYGAVLDSALLWSRSPKLFLRVALLYGAIDRKTSPIDPALRSLLTVRVSQLNGCRFCADLNSGTLLKRGVPFDKVEALDCWRESNLYSEHERTALEYAESMTLSGREVDDDLIARLIPSCAGYDS